MKKICNTLQVLGIYVFITCILTYPLIFRLGSSVYGFYDHITTDMFATMQSHFWWPTVAKDIFVNPLSTFPFGSNMFYVNATGFLMAPITIIFGYLVSYNLVVIFNLILSAFGMFLLVRHITRSAGAGFIAGIVYAFCPNILVRSYTTFDSTQVQWIPFYTLYTIRFFENRTWKNALCAGGFFICAILFSMPYYLVYMPIHTAILLSVYATKALDLRKVAVVLAFVVVVFGTYYTFMVGGNTFFFSIKRTTADLQALSLQPQDYLIPHPRSALFKGNFKATYWDAQERPEKDSDSDVAYIGYVALFLSVLGLWKGRSRARWFFLASAVVAFWSTMGPYSPSGLIHLYAPFARRILMYKAFVQFGIAGLSGIGIASIVNNKRESVYLTTALALSILAEYAIVPPFLSVNLTETPEIYKQVKALPSSAAIIEVPLRRLNENTYQGYAYYQMFHGKPLFNTYADFELLRVQENMRPFYNAMKIPQNVGQYESLVELRRLGITHLVYHYYIGTQTVKFLAPPAPVFEQENIPGLKCVYRGPRKFEEYYRSPYDYSFADLHEITAK